MSRKCFIFGFSNVYHERLTAIATDGTVHLRTDYLIQGMYPCIYHIRILPAEKLFKVKVFLFFVQSGLLYNVQLMCKFQAPKVLLTAQ